MSSAQGRSYQLQVLNGEQAGAQAPLAEGQACTVSGTLDSDVVLRSEADSGGRLQLRVLDGQLQLQVLQGQVQVGGDTLQTGQQRQVALDSPLQLGHTRLAVVAVADAPAEVLADTPADASADDPPAARADASTPAAPPATPRAPSRPAHSPWPRRLVGAGGALAAVSMGVLAFAYSALPGTPTPEQQARRAEALLHGAGWPKLSVRVQGQALQVDGYLETQAQRSRAEQLLTAEGLSARWQVWVNEALALAVQDVFRVHGLNARAETTGPGAVRVHTNTPDPAVLDGVRSSARRDVPGLAQLDIVNHPAPPSGGATPVIDEPGKRLASIVPGAPPYVVTADGTRYFEGALLPTGHRIHRIEQHQVVLELQGVHTPLLF
jgi:type III secretion protein D